MVKESYAVCMEYRRDAKGGFHPDSCTISPAAPNRSASFDGLVSWYDDESGFSRLTMWPTVEQAVSHITISPEKVRFVGISDSTIKEFQTLLTTR